MRGLFIHTSQRRVIGRRQSRVRHFIWGLCFRRHDMDANWDTPGSVSTFKGNVKGETNKLAS